MTDGFAAGDLHQIAARLDDGTTDLAGMAGRAPNVPDAGRSSAAIAGAMTALGQVIGSILRTGETASGYLRAGSDAYRSTDAESAGAFTVGGPRD